VKDRTIKVDNGWVDTHGYRTLHKHGYAVGGYLDNGVAKYVLYRANDKFKKVHEFNSAEELNNMIKLLIPPEEENR
jgi:hypothetical protein